MATQHGLGVGSGSMIDNGDGTASYRKPATLSQAFRVRSDLRHPWLLGNQELENARTHASDHG